jgi:hypothetical protein
MLGDDLVRKCLGLPPGRNRMTIVMNGFNIDNLSGQRFGANGHR